MYDCAVPRSARLVLCLVLGACAGREPRPDPLAMLELGVDARAEAAAVAESLARGGFTLRRRIDGADVVGLVFDGPGGATALRVVTKRGIALAIDEAAAEGGPARRLDLVAPGGAARDLDRDDRVELLVSVHDVLTEQTCLGVVRVARDGSAREVPLEAGWLAPDACAGSLVDANADGTPELAVVARFPLLAIEATPRITVPFGGRRGTWAPLSPREAPAFFERERRERESALRDARARLDLADAHRLAVELAALARLAGRDPAGQVAAFDRALLGLVVTEPQAQAIARTRAFVYRGWSADR